MAEFIIDEKYYQVEINFGSIKISGLLEKGASAILKDADSASMLCYMDLNKKSITMDVEVESVVMDKVALKIELNPEEYSVDSIVILK